MVSKANRNKYKITATTEGYPELELALYQAREKLGWKGLSCHVVNWFNKNQPEDTGYSLPFWQKEMPLRKGKSVKK